MTSGTGTATNTAVVLQGVGELRTEQRAVPEPGPGEVVVRVEVVTICGSDVHYYERGRIGHYVVESPLVLGHETAGVVTAVGSGVEPARVGSRVALEPGIPCGRCTYCLGGRYNLCPHMRFFATPPVDGSLQQYVVLPSFLAHNVPDEVSFEEAALVEPLAVAVMACRAAHLRGGEEVLVTGAGAIGVLCAQTARAFGAGRVWLSDVSPERLGRAAEFGLTDTVLPDRVGELSPGVLLECSGAPSALRGGLAVLQPGGVAVAIGLGSEPDVLLPLSAMQLREITLTSTFRYANAYPAAIELIRDGRVRLAGLVGAGFPLDEAERAMHAAHEQPTVLRAAVYPQRQGAPS